MSDFFFTARPWTELWSESLWRTSWQGAVAIAVAAAAMGEIARCSTFLSPRIACWAWRLVCLKLLVALLWLQPLALPILRPSPALSAAQHAATLPRPLIRRSRDRRAYHYGKSIAAVRQPADCGAGIRQPAVPAMGRRPFVPDRHDRPGMGRSAPADERGRGNRESRAYRSLSRRGRTVESARCLNCDRHRGPKVPCWWASPGPRSSCPTAPSKCSTSKSFA